MFPTSFLVDSFGQNLGKASIDSISSSSDDLIWDNLDNLNFKLSLIRRTSSLNSNSRIFFLNNSNNLLITLIAITPVSYNLV